MPRSVSILAGYYNVELPNGNIYQATNATGSAGPTVILSDEEFAKVGIPLLGLQDNGNVGTSVVTTQAAAVSAVPTLTSVQNTTTAAIDLPTAEALANALKANYNALQVDVVALRAWLVAEYAALTVAGGPQA